MSAEKRLLEEKLSKKFFEFLSATDSEINEVFVFQDKIFTQDLNNEKERLQFIIDEKDRDLENLAAEFKTLKELQQQRTLRLYTALSRLQNRRKLDQALVAWIAYFTQKKRSKKMNAYVINFYRRGILRKNYKGWKNETQKMKRENTKVKTVQLIEHEITLATKSLCDESNELRAIICNLTEDLRNETLARMQMKFKFEQAMNRGISALNQENLNIQDDFQSHSQGFSEAKRNMLYTPESIIHLTKS